MRGFWKSNKLQSETLNLVFEGCFCASTRPHQACPIGQKLSLTYPIFTVLVFFFIQKNLRASLMLHNSHKFVLCFEQFCPV